MTKSTGRGTSNGEKSESVSEYEYNEKGLQSKRTIHNKSESDPASTTVILYKYRYY
ncbi:MAG: hypothetical protein JST17_07135 [Bacteroidetes bacterium]|nr:hypothetical protein [Bacteroidota bacterium]